MPRPSSHEEGDSAQAPPATARVEDVVLSANRAAEALLQQDVFRSRERAEKGERMDAERRKEVLEKLRGGKAKPADATGESEEADSSSSSSGLARYNTQAERNRLVEQLLAQHGLGGGRGTFAEPPQPLPQESAVDSDAQSAVLMAFGSPEAAVSEDRPAEDGLFGDNVFEAAALLPGGAMRGEEDGDVGGFPAGATTLAWNETEAHAARQRARGGGARRPAPAEKAKAKAKAPQPADIVGAMFPSEVSPPRSAARRPRPASASASTPAPAPTPAPTPASARPGTASKKKSAADRAAALNRLAQGQSVAGAPPARHSKDAVRERLEQERQKECTFKPRINSRSRATSSGKQHASGDERIKALAQSRASVYERREAERQARMEAELNEHCTFAPKVAPPPPPADDGDEDGRELPPRQQQQQQQQQRRGARPPGVSAGETVTDRLFNEATKRASQREQAKAALEQDEQAAYSYRPEINPQTYDWLDVTRYRPIHERVGELQRDKAEQLQQLRSQRERDDPNLTFQPAISAKSAQMAETARLANSGQALDVTSRLMAEAAASTHRKVRLQVEHERTQEQQNSFQPEISRKSREIASNRRDFQQRTFVERQETLQQQSNARARAKQRELERACTFAPDVGNAEVILQQTRPGRLRESQEEQAERLTHVDAKAREMKRETLLRKEREGLKFKPQLNSVSRGLGRASTIEELVADERAQRSRLIAKARAEEEMKRQCSFKPKVNAASIRKAEAARAADSRFHVDLSRPEDISRKIAMYQGERQEKLEATRRAKEFDELEECTFMPATNPSSPLPAEQQGPVIVRGLGRFLELREMAKRLEQEKADRERKAFAVKYRNRSHTVAEPFKLSDRKAAEERRLKLAKEVHDAEMRECTFKPKTLESVNRRLLADLMNSADEDYGGSGGGSSPSSQYSY